MSKKTLNLNKYVSFSIKNMTARGSNLNVRKITLMSGSFWIDDLTLEFSDSTVENDRNYDKFIARLMEHFYPEDFYKEHDAKVIKDHWNEIKTTLIDQDYENGAPYKSYDVDGVSICYGLDYRFQEASDKLATELLISNEKNTVANDEIESLKRQLLEAEIELKVINRLKAS